MRDNYLRYILIIFLLLQTPGLSSQRIFEVSRPGDGEGEDKVFVSLSDVYRISEHPDSLPLPNIEEMGEEILEYCIKAASGEVVPKAVSLNQDDFIPWKRGVSL